MKINPVIYKVLEAKLNGRLGVSEYIEDAEQVLIYECEGGHIWRRFSRGHGDDRVEYDVSVQMVTQNFGRITVYRYAGYDIEQTIIPAIEFGALSVTAASPALPVLEVPEASLTDIAEIRLWNSAFEFAVEMSEVLVKVANGTYEPESLVRAAEWLEGQVAA